MGGHPAKWLLYYCNYADLVRLDELTLDSKKSKLTILEPAMIGFQFNGIELSKCFIFLC